jgi:DNA replication and repair protein RecF
VRVISVSLTSFRAWSSLELELPPGVCVLAGPNASGKTSVLEAIWYAAALRSHRTSTDEYLVRRGDEQAIVRASVVRDGSERAELVEIEIRGSGRARAKLGGAPVTKRRDVLGVVRAAMFAPERVDVVRGDPGDRRSFADELLVQLHPRYHAVARAYDRALRQRNALLRDVVAGRAGPAGLEAWDEALAAPGGELCAGRASAIAALVPFAAKAYAAVGEGDDLVIAYAPNVPEPLEASAPAWTAAIRERLNARRSDELVRGVTLAGPHRDDLEITIGGLPARTHASQGEAWMGAVAMVLGTHDAVGEAIGEPPVLLLDDAFSPLDPGRRERLVSALPPRTQTLVSAADPSEVPASASATRIDVTDLAR